MPTLTAIEYTIELYNWWNNGGLRTDEAIAEFVSQRWKSPDWALVWYIVNAIRSVPEWN